jgi:hypothetical protein
LDTDQPRIALAVRLPREPIAWTSANVIAHMALTPVTVAVDIVLLPFWVIGFGLYVAGVGH